MQLEDTPTTRETPVHGLSARLRDAVRPLWERQLQQCAQSMSLSFPCSGCIFQWHKLPPVFLRGVQIAAG